MREFNSREELLEHYRQVQARMNAAAYVQPPLEETEPEPEIYSDAARIDIDGIIRDIVDELLEERLPPKARVRKIIGRVEKRHGLEKGTLIYNRRSTKEHVTALREVIAETWTTVSVQSKPWLGLILQMDHTTVLHHLQKLGLDSVKGKTHGNLLKDNKPEATRV